MKKNIFFGAVISYDVIKEYYRDNHSFDRFVFQQMMDDGDRTNDHYQLVVYAIDKDKCVLNDEKPLAITKKSKNRYVRSKNVFFANIELHRKQLDYLYAKPSSTSELRLYPKAYDGTDYVSYVAETSNSAAITVSLDPSPPAKSPA